MLPYKKLLAFSISLICLFSISFGQKRILDHSDFKIWNEIKETKVSPNGAFVSYSIVKGERDPELHLVSERGNEVLTYEKAEAGRFTFDSKHLVFKITLAEDSLWALKRKKVKKKNLPKDTLAIYDIQGKRLTKHAGLVKYKVPEKWSGAIAYQLDQPVPESVKDSLQAKDIEETKPTKKVGEENGYHLIVDHLGSALNDTFPYVTSFSFAKEADLLSFVSMGRDSTFKAGLYAYDIGDKNLTLVHESKGTFEQITWNEDGTYLAFMLDADTTKALIRPFDMHGWVNGSKNSKLLVAHRAAALGDLNLVSPERKITFANDGSKLFFGRAADPILKDTSQIDEETVNVEVWTYNEPLLYTVQEMRAGRERKRSYLTALNLSTNKLTNLGSKEIPEVSIEAEGNEMWALGYNSEKYQLQTQWEGGPAAADFYAININSGAKTSLAMGFKGRLTLSPAGQYAYGYNLLDSTYVTINLSTKAQAILGKNILVSDERNNSPNFPRPYGIAGWTTDDEALIIYDRYDLWRLDPEGNQEPQKLTSGREQNKVHRYLRLDPDERAIDTNQNALLSIFDESEKSSGYASLDFNRNQVKTLMAGAFRLNRPTKALFEDQVVFTQETFEQYPDLLISDFSFKNPRKISNANPQQSQYNWGTIELVKWKSLDGVPLEGLLIKPENFDPAKKYPMLVNFYERSADGLHRHRAPSPGRSTINYSFYTSRGYVIFVPNVEYKIGYPGESAFNCVISGVNAMVAKGFVDADNIGAQGHSWGGYQIAYLVTRSNIFKAAEAGAPVPNMISAYGGIRWWTGLSRQFQYEHTQSRIGGTPWEYPMRYIENSPIFFVDKIQTPLLIMHNDADGHVPWYQGIEFFVALRRLNKPSWFLNYNGEPHWPLKRQNREDFNIRMAQFFDHYLKGEPLPKWMDKGVPAIQKGIIQNY